MVTVFDMLSYIILQVKKNEKNIFCVALETAEATAISRAPVCGEDITPFQYIVQESLLSPFPNVRLNLLSKLMIRLQRPI
jgi:hypothetical protein